VQGLNSAGDGKDDDDDDGDDNDNDDEDDDDDNDDNKPSIRNKACVECKNRSFTTNNGGQLEKSQNHSENKRANYRERTKSRNCK